MQLNVLEESGERIKVEVRGETETLTQVIARQVWEEGAEAASVKSHPFMVQPFIVVKGTGAKKKLVKAAQAIEEKCEEFREEFKKALQK